MIYFVASAHSRSGVCQKLQSFWTEVNSELESKDYTIVQSQSPEDLDRLFTQVTPQDIVVGIGGDGTINRLLSYVQQTNCYLLILPGGTANDSARYLGHSLEIKRYSNGLKTPMQYSLTASVLEVINQEQEKRLFLSGGGIGYISAMSLRANQLKQKAKDKITLTRLLGVFLYLWVGVVGLFQNRLETLSGTLTTTNQDNQQTTITLVSSSFFVTQLNQLGRYMSVHQKANWSDSQLYFSYLNKMSIVGALFNFAVMLRWFPVSLNKILTMQETKALELQLSQPTDFCADGDWLLRGDRFKIQLSQTTIKLLTFDLQNNDTVEKKIAPIKTPESISP
jgi:diacylglycerol kinase family enzyme